MMLASLALLAANAANALGPARALAVGPVVPWGYYYSCEALYRGPCGAPVGLSARFERDVVRGSFGVVSHAFSLGVGVELDSYLGGGAQLAGAGAAYGLARWGAWVHPRVELAVLVSVGAIVTPSALFTAALYLDAAAATRIALTPTLFAQIEAGAMAGRVLLGARW